MLRMRYKVTSIQHFSGGSKVVLMPVPSTENEQFFESIPTGSITFGTLKSTAAEQFRVDSEHFADFTPAPPPPPSESPPSESEDDEPINDTP